MNEFTELRKRAKVRRDKIIAQARKEFEANLLAIAKLEQELLGRVTSRYNKVSACIEASIPQDRPFTTLDIMTSLEALDSGRIWRIRCVNNHLSRLKAKKLITRIKKCRGSEPAVYVRAGVQVEKDKFADMNVVQVAETVLTRPMTTTELVMAMLDAGYQSSMTKRALRSHVSCELRRSRFAINDGKWAAAS